MSKRTCLACFCAVGVAGWLAAAAAVAQDRGEEGGGDARPEIRLSPESWDFGKAVYGEMPSKTFRIINDGDARLEIYAVRGSCACTAPSIFQPYVEPGESADVTVVFNTKKKRGDVHTYVEVRSNDPDNRVVKFKVTGFVEQVVAVDPPSIVMRADSAAAAVDAVRAKLVNNTHDPFRFTVQDVRPAEAFEASVEEDGDGGFELVVRPKPPLAVGLTRGRIIVSAAGPTDVNLNVPVTLEIHPRLEAQPAAIYVNPRLARPTRRRIRLCYFGEDEAFRIVSVRGSHASIVPTLRGARDEDESGAASSGAASGMEESPTAEFAIGVELPAGNDIPEGAAVIVETTDPDFRELRIAVTNDPRRFRELARRLAEQRNAEARRTQVVGRRGENGDHDEADDPEKGGADGGDG